MIRHICIKIYGTIGLLKKPNFRVPESSKKKSALLKWKDLTEIYKEETDSSVLKEAKFDYATLHGEKKC